MVGYTLRGRTCSLAVQVRCGVAQAIETVQRRTWQPQIINQLIDVGDERQDVREISEQDSDQEGFPSN